MEKLKVLYEAIKHVLGFVSKLTPLLDEGVDKAAASVQTIKERRAELEKELADLREDVKTAWEDKSND